MKKTIIAATLFALTSSAAFAAPLSGEVTFNGDVREVSCTIDVNGGGKNAVVNLPVVNTTELSETAIVKKTPFKVELKNCLLGSGDAENGRVAVSWAEADLAAGFESKGFLANKEFTDPATGVYLALTNKGGNEVIVPGAPSANNTQEAVYLKGKPTSFEYEVGYIAPVKGDVAAGRINSSAVYNITYQ